MKKYSSDDLWDLVEAVHRHGDIEGSAAEIGDLRELLELAFHEYLTEAQRKNFWESEEVQGIYLEWGVRGEEYE